MKASLDLLRKIIKEEVEMTMESPQRIQARISATMDPQWIARDIAGITEVGEPEDYEEIADFVYDKVQKVAHISKSRPDFEVYAEPGLAREIDPDRLEAQIEEMLLDTPFGEEQPEHVEIVAGEILVTFGLA